MAVKVKSREVLQSITAYPLGKSILDIQKELGLPMVRNMSEIENVFGCSPLVKEQLKKSLNQLFHYPDGSSANLTLKLSEFLGVDQNQLFIGNGSDEIIRLLLRAFLNHREEAIMADITFPRYRTNVAIEGGVPILVPLESGVHNLSAMYDAINRKTKMVFVCNPNNPTGTIVPKSDLIAFIDKVPENILIILDEAYYEYATSEEYLQSISLLEKYHNLVILRTFSKVYGLAGLRVGYGIMNSFITSELTKVKEVFNVNQLGQTAAVVALDDQGFREDCIRQNEEGKAFLEKALHSLGFSYFPTQSNFMMIHVNIDGNELAEALLNKGIIVKSGKPLGYPESIRVTISSMDDNRHFIEALKMAVKECVQP
ncbi:histidinol-phosphate transaminase [Sutcliffiella rhizosphaerae]|uniref:Histidinol-phosphate aminotransferase n=1 Tax=Sutcliffiella rhizosphaerae TaxID=2880967 RepID=A0ABN8A962_9BACI|nr:histidinol-phosphate transaminase [Sutcliffiella rhizosphaerae]CAG9621706.1 Histidinol-phosphate aminotransferase [Sutcliffiella rhizosphaerae]